MSATLVDERIVEMQFDNKNFEKNVQESMNTIDKLNQKLKFDESKDAFSNISKEAKKFDLSSINNAVDDVKVRFSGMQMAFNAAIQEIVHTAFSAGKDIVSAIAIKPIKSGLDEYQTYMTSLQTILSNTMSKGTTLADVYSSLDDLNFYADKTIYNFTQMTRSIGSFTAAGVGLEESTAAIKGIANLAAVSGVNAEKASNSMYHFSQAMAAGYLQLRNWNGIVTAGMGGEIFQEELKQTARELGKDVDKIIEKRGSFRESLRDKWLDQEVLTRTLQKFTGDLTAAQLKEMGYADTEVQRLIALGKNANEAATKVKDLKQLIDTLNEALQSGWTMSWRIIVGDFYQARNSLTKISNVAGEFIEKAAEQRNNYLIEILASDWTRLIHNLGAKEKDFVEILTNATDKYGTNNKKMFEGIIKNSETAEEAFSVAVRQGVVNVDDLRQAILKYSDSLIVMREDGRKAAGITEEQFKYVMDLSNQIRFGNDNLEEFIRNTRMNKLSARQNVFETIIESLKTVMSYVNPIKNAFADTFLPGRDAVWKFTNNLLQFVKRLALSQENADRLYRIFKGLLSPLKIVGNLLKGVGKAFGNVFKVLTGFNGSDVLEFFARIGDRVSDFANRIKDLDIFRIVFEKIFTAVGKAAGAVALFVGKVVDFVKTNETIQRIIGKVSDFFTFIWDWITDNVPKAIDALEKFWQRLAGVDWRDKAQKALAWVIETFKRIKDEVTDFVNVVIEKFNDFGTSFRKSKIYDYLQDLIGALKDIGSDTVSRVSELLTGIAPDANTSRNLSKFEEVLMVIIGAITTALVPNTALIREWADSIKYVAEGLMDAFEWIAPRIGPAFLSIFTATGDFIRANSNSIKTIIVSIVGIVVESLVEAVPLIVDGFVRMLKASFDVLASRLPEILDSFKDFVNKVFPAIQEILTTALKVAGLIAITRILGAVDDIFETISDMKNGGSIVPNRAAGVLKSIAFVILSLAAVLAAIWLISRQAGSDPASVNSALQVFTAVSLYSAVLGSLILAAAQNLDKGKVKAFAGISASMLLVMKGISGMLMAIAIMSRFSPESINAAQGVLSQISLMVAVLFGMIALVAAKFSDAQVGAFNGVSGSLAAMIGAITALAGVVAVLSFFDQGKLKTASGVVVTLGVIVAGLVIAFAGSLKMAKDIDESKMERMTGALGTMTGAVATMAGVVALLAQFKKGDVWSATGVIAVLGGLVTGLMYAFVGVSKMSKDYSMAGLATTIGMLAGLVGTLGGVVYALASLDDFGASIGAVAALSLALGALVGLVASLSALSKTGYSANVTFLLLGLSAALTGLGIAFAGLGAGFIMVITGLKMLSNVTGSEVDRMIDNLTKLAKGFINLIPDVFLAIGEASATIIIGLAKHSHEVTAALLTLLLDSIVQLSENLPDLIAGLSEVIIKSLDLLTRYSPPIIAKLFDFIHVVLRGVIERTPELMKDFVDLVAAVFSGLSEAFEAVDPQVWGHGLNAITYLGGLITYLASFGPMIPLAFASAVEIGILFEELAGIMWVIGKSFGGDKALDTVNKGGDVLEGIGRGIGRFLGGIVTGAIDQLPAIAQQLSKFAEEVQPFIDAMAGVDPSSLTGAEMLANVIKTFAETGFIETASGVATGLAAFFTGGVSLIGTGTGTKSILDDFTGFCETVGEGLSTFSTKTKGIDVDTIGVATSGLKTLAEAYEALPVLARNNTASDFMENLAGLGEAMSGFIDKMKGVSASDASTASAAAKAVTDFIGGMPDLQVNYGEIASWGRGDGTGNIGDFKNGLVGLADSLAAFGEASRDIKPGLVTRGIDAADAMYEMIGKYVDIRTELNGFWNTGSGFKGFGDEEKGLHVLAKAIAAFGRASVEIDVGLVKRGAEAGAEIAKVFDALQGFPAFMTYLSTEGGNIYDPDIFKTALSGIAEGISGFSDKSSGIGDHVGGKARIVANVIKFLGESPIDSEKGMIKWLMKASKGDMDTFGFNLGDLATALYNFEIKSSGITDTEHLIMVAEAAAALSDALTDFPDLTTFGQSSEYFEAFASFGDNLAIFAEKMDPVKPAHVTNAITAVKGAVDMLGVLAGMEIGAQQLIDRAGAIKVFGYDFAAYAGIMEDFPVFDVIGSANALNALVNALNSAGLIDPHLAGNLVSALAGLGGLAIDEFINNIAGAGAIYRVQTAVGDLVTAAGQAAKSSTVMAEAATLLCDDALSTFDSRASDFTAKGESLASYLASGLNSATAVSSVGSSIGEMLNQVVTRIRAKYQQFYNAGEFLVRGFANGISGSGSLAYTAAYKIGANAVSSLRSGAGVKSPSIYGYEAGMFLGQGFTNGITEAMEKSNESAYTMGSSAVQAMNEAISNMSDQLNAELDTQPIIRPVLDLSNVQSRSHMLASLLSRDQAMAIGANVNNEKALEIQNGLKVPEPGDNYSFVQNNYSPKALSRIEIYRQTKNQFSAMKGLATES